LARVLGAEEERQSRLIIDGGIIDRERAGKQSIAGDAMRIGGTRRDRHHDQTEPEEPRCKPTRC
jgi:hypothetical protein